MLSMHTSLVAAERLARKLRAGAAADKNNSFPNERPPRHASFMRWLDGTGYIRG